MNVYNTLSRVARSLLVFKPGGDTMTSGHFSHTFRADIRRLAIRSFTLAMLGSVVAIGFSSGLRAEDPVPIEYASTGSGSWSDPDKWSPTGVPGAIDTAAVYNAMTYSATLSGQLAGGFFYGGSGLTLQRDLTAEGTFDFAGANVDIGAFTLTGGAVGFRADGDFISTLTRTSGRIIALGNIGVKPSTTITLTGDDRTPAAYVDGILHLGSVGGNVTEFAKAEPGGVVTASAGYTTPSTVRFDVANGGTLRFVQGPFDSTGLTVLATGVNGNESGFGIDAGGVIDLAFWSPTNPTGWALKWANPDSGGDRLTTLEAWKTSGALTVNGVADTTLTPWPATVTMWAANDGFTYVGVVPEPSTLVLAACGVGAVALAARRRRSA